MIVLRLLASILACVGLLTASGDVAVAQIRIQMDVAAPDAPEPVFLHARDACERWDVPDVAARAYKDRDNVVHLVASHTTTRRMSGTGLSDVRPECSVLLESSRDGDPAKYRDRSWLAALYTSDGQRIDALLHDEFHGHLRRDLCRFDRYMACWRNAITAAVSNDGGRSFAVVAPPKRLVAGLPYRYDGSVGRHTGYFNPSNIVEDGGFHYAFFWAEPLGLQERGACLMRTSTLADPSSWRGYDGREFTVRFIDPYVTDVVDASRHICTPVAKGRLTSTVWTVVRHEGSGQWIAVLAMKRRADPKAQPVSGIWYAVSGDLISWSEPNLLLESPILTNPDCDQGSSYFYPSLIDPNSRSRNFSSVGDHPFLYLTRLTLSNCRPTAARDLVRLATRIRSRTP